MPPKQGRYVAADIERPPKLTPMDVAERVVLPVDESKFAHPEPVVLCELDRHLPQWSASFTTRP